MFYFFGLRYHMSSCQQNSYFSRCHCHWRGTLWWWSSGFHQGPLYAKRGTTRSQFYFGASMFALRTSFIWRAKKKLFLSPVHTYTDIFESGTFSLRIQKFPHPHLSVFKSNLPVHTYPTRFWIHSSCQDSSGNIGNRACVEVAILNTVFTVKDWAQSCYVTG